MILEELARICHQIRSFEDQFKIMKNIYLEELSESAINNMNIRENNIVISLYNIVKKYALEDRNEK